MRQPKIGISERPLIFAQISNGISKPDVIRAKIVYSSRVIDVKSNMFLHLFYNKPFMENQGYNHAVDRDCRFKVKSLPALCRTKNQDTSPLSAVFLIILVTNKNKY